MKSKSRLLMVAAICAAVALITCYLLDCRLMSQSPLWTEFAPAFENVTERLNVKILETQVKSLEREDVPRIWRWRVGKQPNLYPRPISTVDADETRIYLAELGATRIKMCVSVFRGRVVIVKLISKQDSSNLQRLCVELKSEFPNVDIFLQKEDKAVSPEY